MDGFNFNLFSPFHKSFVSSIFENKSLNKGLAEIGSLPTEKSLRTLLSRTKVGLAIANAKLDHTCENLVFAVRSLGSRRAQRLKSRKISLAETVATVTADVTPQLCLPELNSKNSKKTFEELVDGYEIRTYYDEELLAYSDSQLLELATERKDDALALQLHIENCSMKVLNRLSKAINSNIEMLLDHPTGNFVVQKLIKRDLKLAELISMKCKGAFKELAKNEFSSRVMQCLIETNQDFRKYVLNLFNQDLDSYIQSFSSAFLVSVAIRHADHDSQRDFIKSTLQSHTKKWLAKKYFKRVLVAYISSCSEIALVGLFKLLTSVLAPYDFFRDRYSCLILLTFTERGFTPASDIVLQCINEKPYDMLRWSVFRYFLEHISQNRNLSALAVNIHQILTTFSDDTMLRISENNKTQRNYYSAMELINHFV